MKISPIQNSNLSFKSYLNNKTVLKGLEFVSDHSASFIAGTSLAMASFIKPLAISITPDTKKENKEYAITNSITSGLIKFAMMEAVALPIENAVKKIDKNPEKYLKKDTIANLKAEAETLAQSKNYNFATQAIKLSGNFLTAIPKSVLTVALIPLAMDVLFKKKKKEKTSYIKPPLHPVFNNDFEIKSPSFKGLTDATAAGIGKLLNNESVQNIVKKNSSHSENIAKNMSVATDLLLSASFAQRTLKSKKIDEKRKRPLIYNNLTGTGISVVAGSAIDSFIKKNTRNFIEKFSQANKNDPKLAKYISGINVIRPTLIFAGIYYGILPIISTFLAEKIDNKQQSKN